jgi:hypothetical protein
MYAGAKLNFNCTFTTAFNSPVNNNAQENDEARPNS